MAELTSGVDEKIYRILLTVSVMGIEEYPGYEDLHFNRLSNALLRKQLLDDEIHVLYDLLVKKYDSSNIKNELIRKILAIVKRKSLTMVKGYEDINFMKPSIARYSLQELYEHELILLYNQLSTKKLPVKKIPPSPIIEAINISVPYKEKEDTKRIGGTIDSKQQDQIITEIENIIKDILDYAKELGLGKVGGFDFSNLRTVSENLYVLHQDELEALLSKIEEMYDEQTEKIEVINSILNYVEEKNIIEVEGFKGIDFFDRENCKEELKELSLNQLQSLLIRVENMEDDEFDDTLEGRILQLLKTMDLFSVPGFEKLNFRKLTRKQLSGLSEIEITTLAARLEEMYSMIF